MSLSILSPEVNELLVKTIKTLKEENKTCLAVSEPGVGKFTTLKEFLKEQGYSIIYTDIDGILSYATPVIKDDGMQCTRIVHTIPEFEDKVLYAENHPDENIALIIDEVFRTLDTDKITFLSLLSTSRIYNGRQIPSNICIFLLGTRVNPVLRPEHAVLGDHCINLRMPKAFTFELAK